MSSGGITQLVAIGAQDVWLTGKPEVSFFRSTYKRHTNFAHVVQRQIIQGAVNPAAMSSIRLERKGDLVSYVYLTKRSQASGGVPSTQNKFADTDIDHIDFLIGGQVIDSQDNTFINTVADPYLSASEQKAQFTQSGQVGTFYPLRFWFCENWQSALPLISLQYHDVEIRIYWGSNIVGATSNIFESWANFTVLDTAEREEFAMRPQNHLMYQVQKQTASFTKVQNLVFNHPIKFITTGFTGNCLIGTNQTSAAVTSNNNIDSMLLQINGVDIGEQKTYTPHFDLVPNYYHCPVVTPSNQAFLIPFCLDTTKIQPTGTLNFSRIDSARLVSSNNFVNTLYAVNYIILKIENGMGGLLYAN
jgi:hypothetical protein